MTTSTEYRITIDRELWRTERGDDVIQHLDEVISVFTAAVDDYAAVDLALWMRYTRVRPSPAVWALTVGVRRPAAVFVQPCVVVVVPGSRFDDGTLLHIEAIKGDENDAQLRQLVTQLRAKAR